MINTIIFDFLSDPMGGLLTSAREFLTRVREYDNESIIIVLELNHSISSYVGHAGNIKWINIHRPQGLLGWRRVLWQNIFLPKIINKYKATVYVSLSHYLPWTISKSVKKIIGISNLAPFSQAAFDAEVTWKKKLRLKLLSKSIVASANQSSIVIALSNTCKQELMIRGVNEQKIVIIPNGVSISNKPYIGDTRISDKQYILCVSHFYRYKNYEKLISAYGLLPESLRLAYRLFLVGKPYDIDYFNEVKMQIKTMGLSDCVVLISGLFGDELINSYKNCSLFIFPSLIENSPITLLEAMACGAPTIATDVPAMREFGQMSILYFDSVSELDLSQKMQSLLSDEAQRISLSKAGVLQSAKYTWDDFSQKLVKTYLG